MIGAGRHSAIVASALLAAAAAIALGVYLALDPNTAPSHPPPFTLDLDPGTPLSGEAPAFTLTDQFSQRVSLRAFRGKVVLLAFTDSQCTTICPLTTAAMVGAKNLLGSAGARVALIGVDANPRATSIGDVRAYSAYHGMTHSWLFLTAPLPRLERVWRAYDIAVAVEHGQIDHTPALFAISPSGRLAKVYLTQLFYASVPQQAQLLAQEAASLLPSHPRLRSTISYALIPPVRPGTRVSLPRAGGGTVGLGPGRERLLLFFTTWDAEVTDLAAQLERLNRYASEAPAGGLPELIGVDEGSVEPSPGTLPALLRSLPRPLAYPVAIDAGGRIADGYGVKDEPWLVMVSAAGRVRWSRDIATSGWPATSALRTAARNAVRR